MTHRGFATTFASGIFRSADADEPLGMQVIHNCLQVGPPPGLFKHTISQIEKAPRGEEHCGAFGGVTPAGITEFSSKQRRPGQTALRGGDGCARRSIPVGTLLLLPFRNDCTLNFGNEFWWSTRLHTIRKMTHCGHGVCNAKFYLLKRAYRSLKYHM